MPISPEIMDENTSDEDDTHFTLKKSIDPSKFTHLFRLKPKLTATNYATWTSVILRSLQTVALHVYLSPDFTIPSGHTPHTKHHPVRWQKANLFVCLVLTATMSEEIQNQIGHLPTAAEMWAEARRLYASATATDWTLAITSLVTTRYADGDDVAAHISKMKGYRRDLSLMQRDIDDELFACFLRISMPSTWDDVFAALPDHYTSSAVERCIRDEYGVRTSQSTASSFHAARSNTGKSAQSPPPPPSPVFATSPSKSGVAPSNWRQMAMAEREKQAAALAAAPSPATTNAPLPDTKRDTDGFETVPEKKVWRPTRLRGKV